MFLSLPLSSHPIVLVSLSQLTRLDLSYNCLRSIPSTITQLSSLQHLNLRANLLTEFSFLGGTWQLENETACDSASHRSEVVNDNNNNNPLANSRAVVAQKKHHQSAFVHSPSLHYRFGSAIFSQLSARRVKKTLSPLNRGPSNQNLPLNEGQVGDNVPHGLYSQV
jgi:hypothetical protein